MALEQAPQQDLGIPEPVKPDHNWPGRYKPQFVVPSPDRLKQSHQLVTMRNTDRAQTHIVIDRFLQGHELRPGETKEIDLLAEDIEYYQRRRRPEVVGKDHRGNPKLIPLVIDGVRDSYDEPQQAEMQVRATEQSTASTEVVELPAIDTPESRSKRR